MAKEVQGIVREVAACNNVSEDEVDNMLSALGLHDALLHRSRNGIPMQASEGPFRVATHLSAGSISAGLVC